jgi:N-methylhydantoinase A
VNGGRLTVGPESAGARPGPACYNRGGTNPTVTDADLILGIIDPSYFLGGRMQLTRELSEQAIATHVAEPLSMSIIDAASAIREVADNQMADVLRSSTMSVGLDPRDFVLFAFGGAGPSHAYRYAAAAGIGSVVVPATATAHSAYGCVAADQHRTFTYGISLRLPHGGASVEHHVDIGPFNSGYAQLAEKARAALGDSARISRWVGMRFRLQVHEIAVPVPDGVLAAADISEVICTFVDRYERMFGEGTALLDSGLEFTTLRLDATVAVGTPKLRPVPAGGAAPTPKSSRPVTFYELDEMAIVPVYESLGLTNGFTFDGPAIVEYPGTTAVVGPNQRAAVDQFGNLVITTGVSTEANFLEGKSHG